MVPAEIAGLAPVAALPSPVASTAAETVESAQTVFSQTAFSVDLASGAGSLTTRAQSLKQSGNIAGVTKSSAQLANGEEKSSAQSDQLSTLSGSGGQAGQSYDATGSSNKDTVASAAKLSEEADANELSAASLSLKAAQLSAPSQSSSQAFAQPVVPSPATGQDKTLTIASSREKTLTIPSSRNPIQPNSPSTNETALSLTSNQTDVPNQNAAQVFAQRQEGSPNQLAVNTAPAVTTNDGSNSLPIAVSTTPISPNVFQVDQSSATPAVAGKSSTSGSGKSSVSGISKTARSVGNSESVASGKVVAGQSSASVADASVMTRDLAGSRTNAGSANDSAKTATTGPDTRETFATLDSGDTSGKPAWIHAGSTQAEAGYQDPTLGWVSVKADTSGGGVHAEVVAGSSDAAQALGSHMAGLNAYLAEHHTPVDTLTLSSAGGGWSGSGSDTSAGQNMQQGAGQQSGQPAEHSADAGSASGSFTERTSQPVTTSVFPASSGGMNGITQSTSQGGHISVIA
jgi:hypothetical protein